MQKLGTVIISLFTIAQSGCMQTSPYEQKNDAELEAMASRLDLGTRYSLYYDVYYSRTPRRAILATKVAEFKESALNMAVQRASKGSEELLAALPIIQSVNTVYGIHCTEKQRQELYSIAGREALGDAVGQQIADSCGNAATELR
jgi:hypothetical protein